MADREDMTMDFGRALALMKAGRCVARSGWNGRGMWVAYSPGGDDVPASQIWSPANRAYAESRGGAVDVLPALTMRNAAGEIVMGWLASQSDMLAQDWVEVEPI